MSYKRIIPRLDIKDDYLVKGINLEGLRVLGKPEIFLLTYILNNLQTKSFIKIPLQVCTVKTSYSI